VFTSIKAFLENLELAKPDVAASVHGSLQHLILDDYQDVNPAQERLIRLLTGPQVGTLRGRRR
jgi:superfamily I DNA/RNA helicase